MGIVTNCVGEGKKLKTRLGEGGRGGEWGVLGGSKAGTVAALYLGAKYPPPPPPSPKASRQTFAPPHDSLRSRFSVSQRPSTR